MSTTSVNTLHAAPPCCWQATAMQTDHPKGRITGEETQTLESCQCIRPPKSKVRGGTWISQVAHMALFKVYFLPFLL